MMMRMPQPQFESLANHRSGMRLITLWAVGWRQPGGIYLWTHVSNLAITVPLINSLPKSVPGEQEFTDSDGLMMLVNSADPHSLRWLGSSKNKKTTTDNGTLPNVMIYMNRVSAGALSASTWSHAVRKLQLISGELYAAAPRICLPPLAHRVLRSAPVMLLKQNCRHISSEQSSWILPPPPPKKEERIQPGGDNIIIFCQTCSRKSSFSRCRPTYHRLALIHFFGQTWCLLQCLSRGSLASEVDNTLRISYSFSFDSPECSPPLSWVLSPAQLSTKHLLQPS